MTMQRPRIARLLSLLALIFFTFTAFAQPKTEEKVKIKARMGLKHKPDGTMMPYSMVRTSGTSYVVLRSPDFDQKAFTKQEPRLDLYESEKLTYIRSLTPLLQRSGKEKLLLEDFVMFNRKPTLIARTGGQEEVALYYQTVEPHLTRQPPAFDRICGFPVEVKERKAMYEGKGNSTREKWSTVIAADSMHMLIHSPELRPTDDGDAFYLLAMVDKQMQVKWQHMLRVDNGSDRSDVLDAAVDSAGNAYVLIKYRYKDGASGGGAEDYTVVLHRVDANDMSGMPLGMDAGYYATGGLLVPWGKHGIAYTGIYAEGDRKQGNFLVTDITRTYESDSAAAEGRRPKLMPFADGVDLESEEVSGKEGAKKEEDGKDEKKENKKLHSTTDAIALIPRADGGFFIVNEIAFSAVWINPESARRYQRFYHGPLQARSFNKDGQELWTTLFRRWSTSDDPILGRTYPVAFNEQLYLFLWDSEATAEDRKAGAKITPKSASGLFSIYAWFDDKGLVRTKPILRNDNDSDLISGWQLTRTGKDEYVLMGTGSLTTVEYLPVRIDFIKETKK